MVGLALETHLPRKKKPVTELPDDDLIRRLFPKKVVDYMNKLVGHEPKPKSPKTPSNTEKDTS